ncbi:MAG: hypothetical protein Sapg2KO_12490 [Saprospiraceae bacterium]
MDFKRLQFIFYSLAAGQIFFAAVVYFMIHQANEFSDIPMLSIIVPVAVLGSIGLGYFMNERFRSDANEQTTADAQMEHYKRRVIMRSAIMEGGNLIALVACLVTGTVNFFLFFAFGIAVFIYFRPTLTEMANDYPAV